MVHSKRHVNSNALVASNTPSKKQCLSVVDRLVKDFLPTYHSIESKYGLVNTFIKTNQTLYPWLRRDHIYHAITKFKNDITITTNDINIPSDTDEDSDNIPTDIPISSIRGRPHGTSNEDKKVYKKKIKDAMTKAASL